jgi:hypothetical protein
MEEVPNARETRDDYQQVECEGCGLSHFVNCKTGKVLGQKQGPPQLSSMILPLPSQVLHLSWIDFVARLCLLRNRLGARSIAVRADTLVAASFKRIVLLQLI